MRERIEEALQGLVGLPLGAMWRAAGLLKFNFGKKELVPDGKGGTEETWDYSLHITCEWRIVGPEGIVTGTNDKYFRAGEQWSDLSDFDDNVSGSSRLDERRTRFMEERKGNPLVVEGVSADNVGSFRLLFSDGYHLDVMPFHTVPYEHWRLFRPGDLDSHFVVTGEGIEDDLED